MEARVFLATGAGATLLGRSGVRAGRLMVGTARRSILATAESNFVPLVLQASNLGTVAASTVTAKVGSILATASTFSSAIVGKNFGRHLPARQRHLHYRRCAALSSLPNFPFGNATHLLHTRRRPDRLHHRQERRLLPRRRHLERQHPPRHLLDPVRLVRDRLSSPARGRSSLEALRRAWSATLLEDLRSRQDRLQRATPRHLALRRGRRRLRLPVADAAPASSRDLKRRRHRHRDRRRDASAPPYNSWKRGLRAQVSSPAFLSASADRFLRHSSRATRSGSPPDSSPRRRLSLGLPRTSSEGTSITSTALIAQAPFVAKLQALGTSTTPVPRSQTPRSPSG